MTANLETRVAGHYARPGLIEAIDRGLQASGHDAAAPSTEALAPVDEFHTAGRATTLMALDMLPLAPGMRVLDAGCGIGGTARHLAAAHGCRVSGIDLTPDFIATARELTRRTGLSEACEFEVGSVLDLPYEGDSFDGAVTFHVAMNIEDRARFYGELARVIRRGGFLCIFDVMRGPAPDVPYPMPWAVRAENSFLKTPDETADLIRAAGFEVTARQSVKDYAISYFDKVFAQLAQSGPPPLGLHLLTGEGTPEKFQNAYQAMKDGQTDPVIIVARRK